jgi:hypothetical protein
MRFYGSIAYICDGREKSLVAEASERDPDVSVHFGAKEVLVDDNGEANFVPWEAITLLRGWSPVHPEDRR